MRRSRKVIKQVPPTFAFVVDGETEVWYLQMLKRNERQIRLNIKPEIPNKKTIEEQFNLVVDLSKKEYSRVFWIVDLDIILKESKEKSKGNETALQKFINLSGVIKREYKNVTIIINNPCLEFWFLLHFERTSKRFESCMKAEADLKSHLEDYEKTQKYFTKQDNDIYLRLKGYIRTAIGNSKLLGTFDTDDPTKAICEMYVLFQADELINHYQG